MSQLASCGRVAPRWSVVGPLVQFPASMAGLPGKRAWVRVEPPLLANAPSEGSKPMMLPLSPFTKPHAPVPVSSIRLLPKSLNVPPPRKQSSGLRLLAMIVPPKLSVVPEVRYSCSKPPPLLPLRVLLLTVNVPPLLKMPPPPFTVAELLERVLLLPQRGKMPPPVGVPERVLLLTVNVPWFKMPPPALAAELPERVLLLTVNVPPSFRMPPPSLVAELSKKVLWSIIATAPGPK